MKQVKPVRALCESAVLLALAIVLSYIQFFKLPFDGAITLASMLPICLISIRFGIKWGLGAAFCYSWSQILQGTTSNHITLYHDKQHPSQVVIIQ